MAVHPVGAQDMLFGRVTWDTLIDARSESEHALDHVPGAENWPSLRDDERRVIGTLYKQVSPFEANKRGAALVAANIARHIEQHVLDKPKDWQPVVYCWRGGKRSHSLALVLGQIGFRVRVIEGGYKAWRAALLQHLPARCAALAFRVVCGPTGCGKTRLLQALSDAGAQVLDLEALAAHRSSVLGAWPGQSQPSQKAFETRIWQTLSALDPQRPVFVESESRKVGNVTVPEALIERMRASPCVNLSLPRPMRVALLQEEYPHFTNDVDWLENRLHALTMLRGRQQVQQWCEWARSGLWAELVDSLLVTHYDPGYQQSTRRHFPASADAPVIELEGWSREHFARAARHALHMLERPIAG